MKTIKILITIPRNAKISLDNAAKSQGKNTSEFVRDVLANYLLSIGAISRENANETISMSSGGDRYNPLMNDPAVPQKVKDQRKANKIKQAARARAAKSAKANNGGIANTGNISGTNVVLGSGKISQKNLRK